MAGAVRRVARLGVRFDGLHHLRAGPPSGAARSPARARRRTPSSPEAIGWYGGIIFSIFLIGWAIGGVVFGVLADRFGRTRTLVFTILIYAVFTGLAALSQTWWELALFRFLTALGIGGEWAAGAALVAEVWPENKRAKAAGMLQSAWAAGFLHGGRRQSAPARPWLASHVPGRGRAGPGRVARAAVGQGTGTMGQGPRRGTAGGRHAPAKAGGTFRARDCSAPRWPVPGWRLSRCSVCGARRTGRRRSSARLPDLQGLDAAELTSRVSYATMLLNVGALAGLSQLSVRWQTAWGRRWVFALMCVGSLVMLPVTFLTPRSYAHVLLLLPLLGFFNNGIFSGFPIYLPELYPTRIRATGAGFCFNVGRVLAATRAVSDRLSGYGAGQLWPRRQRHGVDLSRRAVDSALRAGNQRKTAAGVNRRNILSVLNQANFSLQLCRGIETCEMTVAQRRFVNIHSVELNYDPVIRLHHAGTPALAGH